MAHHNELKHYLSELEWTPQVLCIQETFFKGEYKVLIPGYQLYHRNRPNSSHGGVATYVHKSLQVMSMQIQEEIECISITIRTKEGAACTIHNVYIPPEEPITQEHDFLFEGEHSIVCGDFNAHHPMWGGFYTNTRGAQIEKYILDSDYVLLNTGQGTYLTNRGTENPIDLTMASPDIAAKAQWEVTNELCGSDHFVMLTHFTREAKTKKYKSKYNLGKANWGEFNTVNSTC